MWLLIFKYFCFLLYFVYLVCCVGFPFVGAVLVTFVVIVWFALRGRVDLNMSNFSCLLLLLFSMCACCSLPYFLLIYFCFCLLFLLFISLFTFVLPLFYYCFAFVWFARTHILIYTHAHKHIGRAPGVFGSSFV